MINTIIVEDESDAQELLANIIKECCPLLELGGIAANKEDALILIENIKPDLLFLDIEIQDGTSFDLLESIASNEFKIIFTTAYDSYALKAFRYEAVDYILKPYSPKDVTLAVNRVRKRQYNEVIYNRLDYLVKNLGKPKQSKISISTSEGILVVSVDDIIRVEADRAYAYLHQFNKSKQLISKPLKEFEGMLPMTEFIRVHSGHLVNKAFIDRYLNEDGGYVLMSDGSKVPVSRRRKQHFLNELI